MLTCTTCQARLLHHLYGVLDDADRSALLSHLAECPACQAALEAARQQQRMLAVAAKGEFPEVRFAPVPAKSLPATVALRTRNRTQPWVRWAAAACVLLLLGGAATFAGLGWYGRKADARLAREELARVTREQEELQQKNRTEQERIAAEIHAIEQQIRQLEAQAQQDLGSVQRDFENQKTEFSITHPRTLQAGAPNKIRVDTKRKAPVGPLADVLLAQVVNEKTQALVNQMVLKEGVNDFTLPANMPLRDGDQLTLRVVHVDQRAPLYLASAIGQCLVPAGLNPLAPAAGLASRTDQVLFQDSLPLVTSIYVTHLMTDRPLYRPGETVYFRSLTLERFSLKPPALDFGLHFKVVRMVGGQEQVVEVLDPETGNPAKLSGAARLKNKDGSDVLGPDGQPVRGIGAGAFQLPDDLPGGEYTLVVSESEGRFPLEKRKLIVNRYQAPRLYKDVDFTRKSYGPGDQVTAVCKVAPVEGGKPLGGFTVTADAEVDGQKCKMLTGGALQTDERGQCVVQFRLPVAMKVGEGILAVKFDDGGNVETTVETIPIVLNKLKVEFFPEGGELVGGVKNRVYFQVRTLTNRPAELRGRVVDENGEEVATIETFHDGTDLGVNQGMGRFDFTPRAGKVYELKIDAPQAIEGRYLLPPVQNDGVVLHLPSGVVTKQIDVVLTSAKKDRKLLVGAYCRGKLLDSATVQAPAGKAIELALKPASGVGGVYRVTVFEIHEDKDQALTPIAERLLYRRSPEKLQVQLFTDKKQYTPGDKVTLSLKPTNEHHQAAPAIVVVSVVDKSILKLRNDRTARGMPAHFLLTSEVRGPEDLEYADFLLLEQPRTALGLEVAKAAVALDLLLGTQGWRRFIEQQLPGKTLEVEKLYQADAKRLELVTGQAAEKVLPIAALQHKAGRIVGKIADQHLTLEKNLGEKEAQEERAMIGEQAARGTMNAAVSLKRSGVHEADKRFVEYENRLAKAGQTLFWALGVLLALAALVSIVYGMSQTENGKQGGMRFVVVGSVLFLSVLGVGFGLVVGKTLTDHSSPVMGYSGGAGAATGAEQAQMRMAGHPRGGQTAAAEPPNAGSMGGMLQSGKALPPMAPANAFINPKAQFAVKPPAKKRDKNEEMIPPLVQAFDAGKQREMMAAGGKKGAAQAPAEQVLGFDNALLVVEGREIANGDRAWRKAGKYAEVTQKYLLQLQQKALGNVAGTFKTPVEVEPFLVRQYAHHHPVNTDGVRRDFAETLFWHPVLVLPGDKAVDVTFDLSDAVTRFEVQVWGHSFDGRLGATTMDIASKLPFNIDAKLPTEISSTDKLRIPVALANDTDKNRNVTLNVAAQKLKLTGDAELLFPLAANSRERKILHLQPEVSEGTASVKLLARCDPFGADAIERVFKIVPEGFPIVGKRSDLLKRAAEHVIQLPADRKQWVPGTLKLQVQVFPSTLADLQKGLEALLAQPSGCFEQTSSSNYPNVMILDYLKETDQVQPHIEKKALALMANGYGRLVSFECIDPKTGTKKEGYEWFGQTAPPHEALTAYGLLQFTDMARYQPVDRAMLERTRKYLLGQRDGQGGFKRNPRSLDRFGGAPAHTTDAYIVWALLESGARDDLSVELNALQRRAEKSDDAYFIGLVALSLELAGRKDPANLLLKKLTMLQHDGKLVGTTSITQSGGSQLAIETTALAVLAWLRAPEPHTYRENVDAAVRWIGQQRGGFGGYGSTQSTILALKALIAHAKANKHTATEGELRLFVGGKQVAATHFDAGVVDPIVVELPDEQLLQPGMNTIRVEITGEKNVFPHTLTWIYNALTPANKEACPVRLTTRLSAAKAEEGQTVRLSAVLQNVSGEGQGMAVAILGLPAGTSLPTDLQEMRELVKAGKIDAFEVRGRELVIYWRELAPDARKEVHVNLVCQIPGEFRGPASRAYLYYNADERWWVDPVVIDIAPR